MSRNVINNYAPICAIPGCINRVRYKEKYIKLDGTPGARWHTCCDDHKTILKPERDNYVKTGCVMCGCNDIDCLQIDHIDGNRHNNNESNKQILCANCHQKKTKLNGDHLNTYNYVNDRFDNFFELIEEK